MKLARLFAPLCLAAALAGVAEAALAKVGGQQPQGTTPSPGQARGIFPGGEVIANPPLPGTGLPREDILEVMVKSALMTFNDANASGNYAVLNALLHPEFRQQVPADRLASIFAAFRNNKFNLAPLLVHRYVLTEVPAIDANEVLSVKGQFETRPWHVVFDLAWRRDGEQWRLWRINVRAKPPEQ